MRKNKEELVPYPKRNEIIRTCLAGNISVQRLYMFCLYKMSFFSEDELKTKEFIYTPYEIKNFLNMKSHNYMTVLKKASDDLSSAKLNIKGIIINGKRRYRNLLIFSYIDLVDDGSFIFKLNPDFVEFYGKIKQGEGNYTLIDVSEMILYNTASSFRFAELLKSYSYLNSSVTFKEKELRMLINNDKSDLLWKKYRAKIINPAIEEINKYSEIYIDDIKKARGKDEVTIYFHKISDFELDQRQIAQNKSLIDKILKADTTKKLTERDAIALIRVAENDENRIFKAQSQLSYSISNGSKIENITGWLIAAIKENYENAKSKSGIRNSSFNNFNQREYDFNLLEQKLLNH